MGEGLTQGDSSVAQDLFRSRITLDRRLGDHLGCDLGSFTTAKTSQRACRVELDPSSNFGDEPLPLPGDRPSRRDVFQSPSRSDGLIPLRSSEALDDEMANLDRPSAGASINPTINDETATDPAADGQIQHRVEADPGAVSRFPKGRRGGIVPEDDPIDAKVLPRPFDQGVSVPTGDLVREDDNTPIRIDRPPKPDPDHVQVLRRYPAFFKQVVGRPLNLFENTRGTPRRLRAASLERDEAPVSMTKPNLQLRPADLDAQ